jgi:hypothetical protein
MAGKGGSPFRFLDLPDEIHVEIARIIDPRICSDPSSQHASDPISTSYVYWTRKPSQTLTRLTLVCKRLHHLYAPFSTWRTLYIEVDTPRWAQLRGEQYGPSPSVARVLDYPETGMYARELLIRYKGYDKKGLDDAFAFGNLYDFDEFLAKTPRLDTVRCVGTSKNSNGLLRLPSKVFTSLSSLASLRYIYLGEFDIRKKDFPTFPPMHQVRILRYSPTPIRASILGDLLRFSMPNIHTIYVTVCQFYPEEYEFIAGDILNGILVRCHFLHFAFSTLRECSLSYSYFFRRFFSSQTTPWWPR